MIARKNLLFDSTSLKELLGGSSKETNKATLDTIKTILKQETGSSGFKKNATFGKKRKNGKKSRAIKNGPSSFNVAFDTQSSLQRVQTLRFAQNNVHEYALHLDLPRDDVQLLEKQYLKVNADIRRKENRIRQGFEQLSGPEASDMNFEDAQLLVNFAELDIDIESLKTICFSCILSTNENDESLKIDFRQFTLKIRNYCYLRYFGLCLGESRGWFKRQIEGGLSQHSDGSRASSVHSKTISEGSKFIPPHAGDELSLLSFGSASQKFSAPEPLPLRTRSQPEADPEAGSSLRAGESINSATMYTDSMMGRSQNSSYLPPVLRLKRKHSFDSNRKKLLSKAGFNESMIRTTPRVLKANINDKVDIRTLRWELEMSKEGIKQLDKLVDTNIAWVQSNCDMSSAMVHFSSRTIRKCKQMAAERIFNVLVEYQTVTLSWAFQTWNTCRKYLQILDNSKKYCKVKSIEILGRVLFASLFRQRASCWKPWKRITQRAIFIEHTAAAVEIGRICRGFLGRVYKRRKIQSKKIVFIQCMYRKWKARRVLSNRIQQRDDAWKAMAATDIQRFVRGRLSIWRAKEEAQRRRLAKASIKIQKIARGIQGRKKFSQKLSQKQTQSESNPEPTGASGNFNDLDGLAALTKISNSKSESIPSTARSSFGRSSKMSRASSVSEITRKNDSNDTKKSKASITKEKKTEKKPKPKKAKDQRAPQLSSRQSSLSSVLSAANSASSHLSARETFVDDNSDSASIDDASSTHEIGPLPISKVEKDKVTPQNSSRRAASPSLDGHRHDATKSSNHGNTSSHNASTHSAHHNASQGSHHTTSFGAALSESQHGLKTKHASVSDTAASHSSAAHSSSVHHSRAVAATGAHSSTTKVSEAPTQNAATAQKKEKQAPDYSRKKSVASKHGTTSKSARADGEKMVLDDRRDELQKATEEIQEAIVIKEINAVSAEEASSVAAAALAEEKELNRIKAFEDMERKKKEARELPDIPPEETAAVAAEPVESHILLQQSRASSPVKLTTSRNENSSGEESPGSSRRKSSSPLRPFSSEGGILSKIGSWLRLPGSASGRSRKNKGDSNSARDRSSSPGTPSISSAAKPLEVVSERDEFAVSDRNLKTSPNVSPPRTAPKASPRAESPEGISPVQIPDTSIQAVVSESSPNSSEMPLTIEVPPPPSPSQSIEIRMFSAARRIQQLGRKTAAKKRMKIRKQKAIIVHATAGLVIQWAVITIQRIVRGKLGKLRFNRILKKSQAEKQKRRNLSALKIQCAVRRRQARKKVSAIRERVTKERKEMEWLKSIQKDKKKSKNEQKPTVAPVANQVEAGDTASSETTERPKSASSIIIDEKLRRLEELEKVMAEREQKMIEAARLAEEKAAAMEATLKQMEERARQDEVDRLMRQQLLEMAAGPISHRSDYSSIMRSMSHHSVPPSARSALTRVGSHATPRMREAPPTARSARDGSTIPPDAARLHYAGEDWVQLWDPEERAYYWYCERTQAAQWDAPGAVAHGSDMVTYAHGGGDDSGYESGGALTDYSTDHYESGGEEHWSTNGHRIDSSHSQWHEYWDDLAKAKYWYNSVTGEATWTKPEQLSNASEHKIPSARKEGRNYNPQDWVSYIDEDTGQEYWYNSKTGEASWS